MIKIGALKLNQAHAKPNVHQVSCLFTWNIASDTFELIESSENCKLPTSQAEPFDIYIPPINCKTVLVMDFNSHSSKTSLRDYNNYYEVTMKKTEFCKYFHLNFIKEKIYRVIHVLWHNNWKLRL